MANKTFSQTTYFYKGCNWYVFCIYDTERLHCEMQKSLKPLKTTGGEGRGGGRGGGNNEAVEVISEGLSVCVHQTAVK